MLLILALLSCQVLKLRNSKRQRSRNNRRERLRKKDQPPAVGDVVEGYVRKVFREYFLVVVAAGSFFCAIMYLAVYSASKAPRTHAILFSGDCRGS